jgi:hypothetical protein
MAACYEDSVRLCRVVVIEFWSARISRVGPAQVFPVIGVQQLQRHHRNKCWTICCNA